MTSSWNAFQQAGGGPGGGPGMVYVTFSIGGGQRDLSARLGTWSAAMDDMSEAWTQVGEQVLLRDFRMQFAQEGGWLGPRIGPRWKQLAPSTQLDRARHGFGAAHPILVRRGALEASVTQRGAPNNIFRVGPHSLTVGTADPIAKFHQYGTHQRVRVNAKQPKSPRHPVTKIGFATGRGGSPPRKMIGLRFDSRAEIIRVLGDWVREQARQQGLHLGGSWGP